VKPTHLAARLNHYLATYLPAQRNASPNTVKAYRDVFVLLLRYCRDERGIPPERLEIEQIDPELVVGFLEHLETGRGCGKSTVNHRLAALQAFFRYLQTEEPEKMLHCQRILCVPRRKHGRPSLTYLSSESLAAMLHGPTLDTRRGRRDAVLLSVLYDSGARAQELADLRIQDVRLDAPAQLRLIGKGRKTRVVPLMQKTTRILKEYLREHGLDRPERCHEPLFQNRWGRPLTRWGISHIVKKYAKRIAVEGGSSRKTSPHVLRHTKAMHLLQSGNGAIVIRDFLGHADVKTTDAYARADLQMKEEALKKAEGKSPRVDLPSWRENKDLLSWLKSLSSSAQTYSAD
jgi:site-specific recombinase XerD